VGERLQHRAKESDLWTKAGALLRIQVGFVESTAANELFLNVTMNSQELWRVKEEDSRSSIVWNVMETID